METLLVATALAFAFVNGLNDGGALLSVGLPLRTIRPWAGLLLLSAAVVLTPLLLGTAVATTLAVRLIGVEGTRGQVTMAIAVVVAVAVTAGLARRGLPTTLTLALVGAITGSGLGAGSSVAWRTVAVVLTLAALAPVAGVLAGWALARMGGWWRSSTPLHQRLRRWHVVGFGSQCVAYGLNDGQKMVAVLAVALSPSVSEVRAVPWQLALVGLCFLTGAAVGLPRFVDTIGGGIAPLDPPDAVIAELSSATVVLATGALGSPVSMTQAVSGALVGTGVTRGTGRIRWRAASRLAGAWLLTLPLVVGLAAVASAITVALLDV